MEIWLDTTNLELISHASRCGILYGITTNPTIVARSGQTLENLLESLLDIQDGPVAVQVIAENSAEMIRQAEILTAHSPRVIVKIPVSTEGLASIYHLTQKRVPVMATAIFDSYQALLAYKAGAHYIAPYVGRIQDQGVDVEDVITSMQLIRENYAFETKIIAAGIRTKEFVLSCAELGLSAVTLNDAIYKQLIEDHPETTEAIKRFSEEWNQGAQSSSILR